MDFLNCQPSYKSNSNIINYKFVSFSACQIDMYAHIAKAAPASRSTFSCTGGFRLDELVKQKESHGRKLRLLEMLRSHGHALP